MINFLHRLIALSDCIYSLSCFLYLSRFSTFLHGHLIIRSWNQHIYNSSFRRPLMKKTTLKAPYHSFYSNACSTEWMSLKGLDILNWKSGNVSSSQIICQVRECHNSNMISSTIINLNLLMDYSRVAYTEMKREEVK